jgi:hypothetical protein
MIHDFFSEEMSNLVLDAVYRSGNEGDHFRRCFGISHSHIAEKECFFLNVDRTMHEHDANLVRTLVDEMDKLWPTNATKMDHFDVVLTRAGSAHSLLHQDLDGIDPTSGKMSTVSAIIYLTDGGAGTYFPGTDLLVIPKKGSILTWLNVNPDGSSRGSAMHAVQAAAKDDPDRVILSFRTTFAIQDMPQVAYQ